VSLNEIIVIAFGGFIGYWVVSKLFLGGTPKPAPEEEQTRDEPPAFDAPPGPPPAPAWYEVLQVSPLATVEEIRAAYKTLISQYHPDKVATLGDELRALAERKSAQINDAYADAIYERNQRNRL
jgi:DnaJ like chaperone protein